MLRKKLTLISAICYLSCNNVYATTYTITNNTDSGAGSLRQALIDATLDSIMNGNNTLTINFNIPSSNPTITLTSPLPPLIRNLNVTLDGTNGGGGTTTIDGANSYNAFWLYDGSLNASNINFANCKSVGGDGGSGSGSGSGYSGGGAGGGGLGAGGAIFVNNLATLSLSNSTITNAAAKGGAGAALTSTSTGSGGGGGMIGGNGGATPNSGPAANGGSGGGGGLGGSGGDGAANGYTGGGGGGVLGNGGTPTSSNAHGGGGGIFGNGGAVLASSIGGSGGGGINASGGSTSNNGASGGGGINANGGNTTSSAGSGGGGNGAGQTGANTSTTTGGSGGGGAAGGVSGANGTNILTNGGGGGGGATGGSGGNANNGGGGGGGSPDGSNNGGNGGNAYNGGGGGSTYGTPGNSTNYGGGGGGGYGNLANGGSANIGGGGAGEIGGNSNLFGGGGAGSSGKGGNGGFGGGGGGSTSVQGGNGGFGGGGGGGLTAGGTGGFGAGNGGTPVTLPQGGRALGGGIFVRDGGSVTLSNVDISSCYLTGSSGSGNPLPNEGAAMYIHGSSVVTINTPTTKTIDSSIAGTGSIVKTGSGTLALTSTNNNFTGGITVSDGTLTGTPSSLKGNIINNSNVILQTGSTTYSGNISGTGSVTLNTGANTTLTGALTHTGGTTVNSDLHITTSNIQGNIVNNSYISFDQNSDGAYSGNISGSGSLLKDGTGAITFSGNHSYLGNIQINNGSLIGNTNNIISDVYNGANLTFNQSSDGTYTKVIDGAGALKKTGNGSLNLTAAHTYTGNTLVSAGKLSVNGSLTSPTLTVDTNGILGGAGIVQNVIHNGIIAPGNSIGTLNIAGNYTVNPGAILEIEFNDAGATDLLNITGNAAINGGTIKILPEVGIYNIGNIYTILQTTGTISGPGFTNVIQGNGLILNVGLVYSTNKVQLKILNNSSHTICSSSLCRKSQDYIRELIPMTDPGLISVINTINALSQNRDRGHAYESILGGQRHGSLRNNFTIQSRANKLALNEMTKFNSESFDIHLLKMHDITRKEISHLTDFKVKNINEEVKNSSLNTKSNNKGRYYRRINTAKASPVDITKNYNFKNESDFWFKSFYLYENQGNKVDETGYKLNSESFVIGKQVKLNEIYDLGLFGSVSNNNIKYKLNYGTTTMKNVTAGINISRETLESQIIYGMYSGGSKFDDKRSIVIGAINKVAKSDHYAANLNLYTQFTKKINYHNLIVKPKISFEIENQFHQAYKEQGADSLNLSYKRKLYSAFKVTPAIEISKIVKRDSMTLMPSLGLYYSYGRNINSFKQKGKLVNQSLSFTLDNNFINKSSFGLNTSIAVKHNNNKTIALQYQGEIRNNASDHQASISYEWNF